MPSPHAAERGFTLIELSVVLVIIGLIVGGVLVGQDLIRAAGVRATISQIEKFNTAVNTFRGKYGYLPGDIKDPDASNFGFAPRGQYAGEGDGNGVIEGNHNNSQSGNAGYLQISGETGLFWVDLSQAQLIDNSFTKATTATNDSGGPFVSTSSDVDNYFPQAKLGRGNYIYVWSGGWGTAVGQSDGQNYFGLSANLNFNNCWQCLGSSLGLTVSEAYSMDKKVDDGLPMSGNVLALSLLDVNPYWGGYNYNQMNTGPFTFPVSPASNTCFDNGNISGAAMNYSVQFSNGSNVACALSFRFQ